MSDHTSATARVSLAQASMLQSRYTLPTAASYSEAAASGIIELPDFLAPQALEALRKEVVALVGAERSYVPTHKQGGTVGFASLRRQAPGMTSFYHSDALHSLVSLTVGCPVKPTPLHDQNSLSLLIYDRAGDHIGWHYDHNFYHGRHFTLLVPLVNVGSDENGQSHGRLYVRLPGQGERVVNTSANQAVLFEGARVRHRVSPILAGERRIVLSMTLCSDSRASRVQQIGRRIKDMAYFGVRALWA